VAEGSRVNRTPQLRLADETQKCLEISRHEKNICPRVAPVQEMVKSPINDRSWNTWHENDYPFNNLSMKGEMSFFPLDTHEVGLSEQPVD